MHKFTDLVQFVEFAKANRKYPENTANNLKSALKIFEKVLAPDELGSLSLIEDRIEEIFLAVVKANKTKSIGSLNTYKARVQKVLKDFKRYGQNPAKIQNWTPRQRNFTPLFNTQDKTDKNKDNNKINLSPPVHTPVENVENNCHKIEFCLQNGQKAVLSIPRKISIEDIRSIKAILDFLAKD